MVSLVGDLSTFSPADILQFLGYVRAGGMVELSNSGERVRVYFEEGKVAAATADFHRPLLGTLLCEAGHLTEDRLSVGLERSRERKVLLGEVLVEEGWVSRDDLNATLEDQLVHTLHHILRWDRGSFRFLQGFKADVPEQSTRSSLDRVLFEGLRRLDEEDRSLDQATQ